MKLMSRMLVLPTLALTCTAAVAQVADVSVDGYIDKPAAVVRTAVSIAESMKSSRPSTCVVVLGNKGVFDYGVIDPSTLSENNSTQLHPIFTTFAIECPDSTKVAFRVLDHRIGSAAWSVIDAASVHDAPAFGLGTIDGKKLGAYAMTIDTISIDGRAAAVLASTNDGKSWDYAGSPAALSSRNCYEYTIAASGATIPTAGMSFSGYLQLQAVVDSIANLPPLTNPVRVFGDAIFVVQYL